MAERNQELYYDEIKQLEDFRVKLQDTHTIYKKELDEFTDQYEELVAQAKVITRVSDRLQKKLDSANMQIREQNEEISQKNTELNDAILQLARARVGRRASAIILFVAFGLFVMEQLLLEPIIDDYVDTPLIGLGILGVLFFLVKQLEGALEKYFMEQEKKKILAAAPMEPAEPKR
jgi:DNA repair exonuclease SbcCD ATPase subunit